MDSKTYNIQAQRPQAEFIAKIVKYPVPEKLIFISLCKETHAISGLH